MEALKKYRADANTYAALLAQITTIVNENRPVGEIVGIVQEFDKLKTRGRT